MIGDRTKLPVKLPKIGGLKVVGLKINFPAPVHDQLCLYSEAYTTAYGDEAKPEDLVPVIVSEYLRRDIGFRKYLKAKNNVGKK